MASKTRLAFQDDHALLTPGPLRDKLLREMRAKGAKDLRINAVYGKLRENGQYNFGVLDELVNAARAHGLAPQLTLMGTPTFNPQLDQALSAGNPNPAVMTDFARAAAQHFRGRVNRYSVWNEPNWNAFLSDQGQAAVNYRRLYRAGYDAIKGVDRGNQVLLGEMTSQPHARQFLKRVLSGKPLRADGFAYHPYDEVKLKAGMRGSTWDIDTLPDLQRTLRAYWRNGRLRTAAGRRPGLYLTEFGTLRDVAPDRGRRVELARRAYGLAQDAGAKQFLQYQLTPKPQRSGEVRDAYGGVVRPAGWVWDTSVGDEAGNIPDLRSRRVKRRRK